MTEADDVLSLELDGFTPDALDPLPPWRFRFPLVGARRGQSDGGFVERSITVDASESGDAIVDVVDADGALVLHGGEVLGVPPSIRALTAADFAVRDGPCSAGAVGGHFAGVELRDVDSPLVLAAGNDVDVRIARRAYVAGAPWAFVSSSGTFDGWAYVWRN